MKWFPLIVLWCVWFSFDLPTQGQPAPGTPPVSFVKVARKDVQIDPFVSSTLAAKYRGKIVYDDQAADRNNSYDGHPLRNHVLLRRVGGAALNAGALAVYLSKGESGAPYDPQFSPDGRFVLWKFGIIGSPYVSYAMFVLDLKTGVVKRVENPLTGQAYYPSVREVYWSPDIVLHKEEATERRHPL